MPIIRAVYFRGGDTPNQLQRTSESADELLAWARRQASIDRRGGFTSVQLWVELWRGGRCIERKILQKAR